MNVRSLLKSAFAQVQWWAFSFPILIKILGIGFLVTFLFGAVAFYQIRVGMYRTHYQVYGETALFVSQALAERIEPLVRARDTANLDRELSETMRAFPDVRYIVVQDGKQQILSHGFTFPSEAPPDLVAHKGDLCASCHATLTPQEIPADLLEVPQKLVLPAGRIRAYTRQQGLILEVTVPIGSYEVGTVRLGAGSTLIAREINAITRSLLWSLALCLVVSLSLALALAYVLVRPIHNLVQVTNQVRDGQFDVRAGVFAGDEIGQLAVAFNEMAESIESYRREVSEKEKVRLSLIGKIVETQEEERKSVARELHDQLGQSLSHTLLTIETSCKDCPRRDECCSQVKTDIRSLIDDVRRLAWDVRPAILDDYGLDKALARYVEETAKRMPFRIDYQCVCPPSLPRLRSQIEVTLYRITQEAVTNVLRHAHASQVSIVLLRQDDEVNLIIEDDGGGFDVATKENSLGIIGMRERAALVGGQLVVESFPQRGCAPRSGKGTAIRVIIPVTEAGGIRPA